MNAVGGWKEPKYVRPSDARRGLFCGLWELSARTLFRKTSERQSLGGVPGLRQI